MSNAIKTEFPVFNGYAPASGGAKAMPISLDFTVNGEIDFDLITETQRGIIDFVQSAWIDNSNNPNPLSLIYSQTGQAIVIPAKAQGIWPVIAPSGLRCTATTTPGNGVVCLIIFLNVPMPMTQFGPTTVTGVPFVPATGAYTNKSVAATGNDLILIPANANRKGYLISAPSANANSVFVSWGAAATQDFHSYEIMPGGNLPNGLNLSLQDVHAIGTVGDNITAYELA